MQEIIITGNIGKDAEVIQTRDGRGVLTVSVAVNDNKEEAPTWYDVFVNGNYDKMAPYLVKGTRVLVRGRLKAGMWTNQQGKRGISLQVSTNTGSIEILKFADDNNVGSKAVSQSQPRSQQTEKPMPQGQGWQTAQQMQQRQSGEKMF